MSNIEKLRQKIENSIKAFEFNGGIYDSYEAGELSAYQEILNIIDSLPEEKPSEDLNNEIKKFIEEYGYERGEDKLLIAIVARHFANWQKEQMLKDAVEGEVCGRVYDHINVRFADGVCKYLEPKNISHIPADVSKYKVGDKVRIIIVKED